MSHNMNISYVVILPLFLSLCIATKRQFNSLETRCHGDTCDYIVEIKANGNSNDTAKVSLPRQWMDRMSKFETILTTMSKIIQLEHVKTTNDINAVQQNFTALQEQMQNRTTEVYNGFNTSLKQMTKEIQDIRSQVFRLSGVVSGAGPIGSSIVAISSRPSSYLQTNATAVDCATLYKAGLNISGIYTLKPDTSDNGTTFDAYCDMDTDGGGWIVIQRRVDGADDFFRNWESYKYGFGEFHHDYWLGLEYAHQLTKFGNNKMRIDLWDWENETRYSEFDFVRIRDEKDKYRILTGGYHGNAGDPFHSFDYFERMQSMRFSTFDSDNDMNSRASCAQIFNSGWWFNNCFRVNLNGVWYPSSSYYGTVANGITWDLWEEHKSGYSLKKTEIKLRPENF